MGGRAIDRAGPRALVAAGGVLGMAGYTALAVAVNNVPRNTAVAIGAQVAFAIIAGAELVGGYPAESGYTWVFAMGGAGAALLLLASALLPGRRSLS